LLLYSKLAEHPGVEYKTVASMTEKTMDLETDEFINYGGAITKGLMSPPKLIIVDEASMISSEDYNLLVDFAKDANIPIIFIGDDGQLPPVEEKKGVSPIFNLKRFNLTERIRQGEDSPILPFADKF
jgi:ATP-dependent exoDNAse (exonuclease V) alpha subunit